MRSGGGGPPSEGRVPLAPAGPGLSRVYLLVPAQAMARQFYETFKEFPPRQRPDSFNLEGILKQMEGAAAGGG